MGEAEDRGSWAARHGASVLLAAAGLAMVAVGAFATGLAEAIAIALIVVGAGMFVLALLLPAVSEFEIGPGGFSAKLREREARLKPEGDRLSQLAGLLAGGPAEAEELLRRAIAETYLASGEVDPAVEARRQLVRLAPDRPEPAREAETPPSPAAPANVLSTLGTMPPEERGAVVLHVLEGLDPEAVARILNRPQDAVVPLIERGIATLGRLAVEGAR